MSTEFLLERQRRWIAEAEQVVERAQRLQRDEPNDMHRRNLMETQRELAMLRDSPLGRQVAAEV